MITLLTELEWLPMSGSARGGATARHLRRRLRKPHKRPELRGVWGPSASGALDAVPHPPGIMASTTRMDKNHTLMTKQN